MTNILQSVTIGMIAAAAAGTGNWIEEHAVSIPTVCAVAGIVVPAVWWLSRKFQQVDDKLGQLQDELKRLPCQGGECKKVL